MAAARIHQIVPPAPAPKEATDRSSAQPPAPDASEVPLSITSSMSRLRPAAGGERARREKCVLNDAVRSDGQPKAVRAGEQLPVSHCPDWLPCQALVCASVTPARALLWLPGTLV